MLVVRVKQVCLHDERRLAFNAREAHERAIENANAKFWEPLDVRALYIPRYQVARMTPILKMSADGAGWFSIDS